MKDKAIIELFFAGSEQALYKTQEKYGKYLLQIAKNILRVPEDAEECRNDVLLKLWESIPPERPKSLKAYIGVVSRNCALNLLEKRNRMARGGSEAKSSLEEMEECLPAESLEEEIEKNALRDALNAFLSSLKTKERQIFMKRYFYMCSISEIARDCGIKESAVKVSLFRTRKKLREYLDKEGL